MAKKGGKRTDAQERERARLYEARRRFHEGVRTRRRRDDVIAGVAGGILLLAVLGGQTAYYTLGPGAPEPTPSPTATPTPTPGATPSATPTPATPSATPTPAP